MPRAYRPKKRVNNKPSMFKKARNVANTAILAYKGYRYLKGLINVEEKIFDSTGAGLTTAVAGAVFSVDNLTQGDTFNTREGNSIKVKSWQLNLDFLTTTSTGSVVRIIAYLDKENRAATPAVTDVLEAASVVSPVNHTNLHRFTIISDKRFTMVGGQDTAVKIVNDYSQHQHHARYNDGNAGTSADYRENHLFFIVIATTANIGYNYYSRLEFIDN